MVCPVGMEGAYINVTTNVVTSCEHRWLDVVLVVSSEWVTEWSLSLVWVHDCTSKAVCMTVDSVGCEITVVVDAVEVTNHCLSDWGNRGWQKEDERVVNGKNLQPRRWSVPERRLGWKLVFWPLDCWAPGLLGPWIVGDGLWTGGLLGQ